MATRSRSTIALGRDDGEASGDTASSPAGLPHETGTAAGHAANLPDSPQHTAARSRWVRLLADLIVAAVRKRAT